MAEVITLLPRLRVVETEPEIERDRVEVTAGLRKVWAVRVDGVIWVEYDVCTLATRCLTLLRGLERVGALPTPAHPSVASMLLSSLAEINSEQGEG